MNKVFDTKRLNKYLVENNKYKLKIYYELNDNTYELELSYSDIENTLLPKGANNVRLCQISTENERVDVVLYQQCQFCGDRDNPLRLSHIIPKLIINRLKNSGSGDLRRSLEPNKSYQDGLKEYMLCDICENKFSAWESKFADDILPAQQEENTSSHIKILKEHQLCILSIIWRALHYSQHEKTDKNELDKLLERDTLKILENTLNAGVIDIDIYFSRINKNDMPNINRKISSILSDSVGTFSPVYFDNPHKGLIFLCTANWVFYIFVGAWDQEDLPTSTNAFIEGNIIEEETVHIPTLLENSLIRHYGIQMVESISVLTPKTLEELKKKHGSTLTPELLIQMQEFIKEDREGAIKSFSEN